MLRVFSGIILVVIGVGNFENNPNWFVVVGLCLIGTLIVVTFYNDILRLIG